MLLLLLIFLQLSYQGTFYNPIDPQKRNIKVKVSRAKWVCHERPQNERWNCDTYMAVKVTPINIHVELFETFNSICSCRLSGGDEDSVFHLKNDAGVIKAKFRGDTEWSAQEGCSVTGFNCILEKHHMSNR